MFQQNEHPLYSIVEETDAPKLRFFCYLCGVLEPFLFLTGIMNDLHNDIHGFSAGERAYMERALQLARAGLGNASPNPMVGAVIAAPDGRIIGEGYHRKCGCPHAEVNAVASVRAADTALIPHSTIFVTLEPCAHYGKTPPCARLLIDKGFRKVIVGAVDPFGKVDGKGIGMMRDAGIDVRTGLLADECRSLNARFFTAHTLQRPFVTLKWAQSLDGFMDRKRLPGEGAMRFSTAAGTVLVHRLRANHDGIAVGSGTVLADCPRLNVRAWHGDDPRRIVFDRSGRLGSPTGPIPEVLSQLYADGITSVMVEGGPTLLGAFIDAGLWDLARVEVAPITLGERGTASAPSLPAPPVMSRDLGENIIYYYSNNPLVNPYFINNGL